MKKQLLFLVFGMLTFGCFAQIPTAKIQDYLDAHRVSFGLTVGDVANWKVESTTSSKATGITNYYINQTFQNIEVYGSNSNIWYKNGEVLDAKMNFVNNLATKINTISPSIDVLSGLNYAHIALNESLISHEIIQVSDQNKYLISNGALTEDFVNAKLVFQNVNNQLKLAWHYEFYSQDYKHLWSVRIDALNGDLLEKFDGVLTCNFGDTNHKNHNHTNFFFTKKGFKESNLSALDIQSGSYRVYPYYIESPNHGSRSLISNPHDVTSSPYGWHDTNGADGAEFTITRGNNVHAQEDINGNNGTGASPDGGASLLFDYPYGGNGVTADNYTDAATTNLFYMNNIMHDVWYHYGFDEPNGNFQQNNYGNGGANSPFGDYVFADSQDGSGTNNANFSTPSDGTRPRMQMFLWDVGPTPMNLVVNSPTGVAGEYFVADNVFSPGHIDLPAMPGLTTDLVLYEDATPDQTDACEAALNSAMISGKIVIVRRGTCPFTQKVLNAQNAGAAAVIVVNDYGHLTTNPGCTASCIDPNQYVGMSGADASITIPAVFVNYNIGEAIIAAMSSNTVNVTLRNQDTGFINADGDFDNVVIAHEYGHGISTRLTGGPATSCLNNQEQMGEGWSDFFGLMMQMKSGDQPEDVKGIGTYVVSEPTSGTGIRTYPYSTDMGINPFTFADTNTEVVPHGVGSVWATMLWDLAWAYVGKYGYDPDIYNGTGGNNKVMQLVLDGLKLQGCSPTFVSGRDALIAADQATTGGQDYCLIWEVFARRGLGQNASSGGSNSSTDQVEDFTVPPAGPNCVLSANYFDNKELIKVYPNPSNGMLNLRVNNYSGELTVEMFDLNGRKVFSNTDGNFSVEKSLNINSLQSGVYLLKLTGDNLTFTQKVIKN
ncbi:T9SS-dependent M36 family metallopeptidase [Flavobacterium okayamense]|nr:T9SS-dependent M36 family metallopeptidase [Flavobacterium okayamense]